MLRILRSLSLALAAAGLLAPAAAHAKTKKTVFPKVTSVSPLKLSVGDTMTIRGSGFRAGAGKTTVVFQRTGKPAIFVKAQSATTRRITLRVPEKLTAFLAQRSGTAVATRFKLRVLTTRFSRTWTPTKHSPTIKPKISAVAPGAAGPAAAPAPAAAAAPAAPAAALTPYEQCQRDAAATPALDADSDGMTNGTELGLFAKTDPCNADSDNDGITDGYEYSSAITLNGAATPYPGKRPWPNPLDPSDANYDFDGDGLLMSQEFALWRASGGHYPVAVYSDGTQSTGPLVAAVTPAQRDLDLDGDGFLTDDERDMDGDGLSNMVEFNYTGTQGWWNAITWMRPLPSSRRPSTTRSTSRRPTRSARSPTPAPSTPTPTATASSTAPTTRTTTAGATPPRCSSAAGSCPPAATPSPPTASTRSTPACPTRPRPRAAGGCPWALTRGRRSTARRISATPCPSVTTAPHLIPRSPGTRRPWTPPTTRPTPSPVPGTARTACRARRSPGNPSRAGDGAPSASSPALDARGGPHAE